MNILQILPELEVGGVERGTVDLAKYLAANGHKSVVVSAGGRLLRRIEGMAVKHYTLPVGRKSPLAILSAISKLRRIIIKEDIQIIHARSRVPAIIGFAAAKLAGRVFITTAHGYYNTSLMSRPMGWGRFVVVASRDMARHMMDDFGVPYDRIRFIPRGVDLSEFRFIERIETAPAEKPANRDFVVGMISRITPLKGHADFLRAAAIMFRKVPNIKVLIAGAPPPAKPRYKEDLEALTRQLGISAIVDFMGSREDVPEILSKLDALVVPTRTPEAFGRIVIEAQAAGVPVVAAKVGGITDIIDDGENGLLVFPEDPRSIAEALLKLFNDRKLGSSLAVKARQRVEERYSLSSMAEKTVRMYEEALSLKKILVIKMSALGDVILAIPSLKALRKRFPSAVIKVLVGPAAAAALKGCAYIDEKIIYDPEKGLGHFGGIMKCSARLRTEDFDIVVDLQNNRTSHLLAFLAMANLKYGYDNGKLSFLLNRRVKDSGGPIDPVSHQFRVLKLLGIENTGEALELWPSKEEDEWADGFLRENWVGENRLLAGFNISASSRWESKKWNVKNIAALCDELARKYGVRMVLTGAAEDAETAKKTAKLSGAKPIIAAGRTDIMQLASLIKRFRVYVTTDSAPLHVAASMRVPVIALFGPTDPARHMPKAENAVVLKSGMKCSPCYRPFCGKQNRCMDRIKVEDVAAAAEKYLKPLDPGGL